MKNELKYYLVDIDKTEKFVFENEDGVLEIIRINTKPDRDIYCVPSMYECKLGCTICHLTINNITGSNKKITVDVIQDCLAILERDYPSKKNRQISVMGVGEPLLNLDLIKDLCAIETRVSIASIFPFIPTERLPNNLKIHYSLHSPLQSNRLKIMPQAKGKPSDVITFLQQHNGDSEIHYTLIEDINDRDEEIVFVAGLLSRNSSGLLYGKKIPVKFLDFKTSYKSEMAKSNKISKWISGLTKYGIETEFYYPPGENIQSSCGLFTEGFYTHESTDEFKLILKHYSKPLKDENV